MHNGIIDEHKQTGIQKAVYDTHKYEEYIKGFGPAEKDLQEFHKKLF